MTPTDRLKAAMRRLAIAFKPLPPPPTKLVPLPLLGEKAHTLTQEWANHVETRLVRLETRQAIYLGLLIIAVLRDAPALIDALK